MDRAQMPAESIQRLERLAVLLQQEVSLLRTMTNPAAEPIPAPPPTARPESVVSPAVSVVPVVPVVPAVPVAPPPPPSRPRVVWSGPRWDALRSSEFWLNKVGIGLLLLGIAFLFKYSVDQGWLTPALRCGMGVLAGGLLLGCGLRLSARQREFSHVLMGGGIATFYLTTFAAFQWYTLLPYALALPLMTGVTILAFVLAVRRDAIVLALIGALGGLATPFLLDTGSANIAGLMGYMAVLLLGTGAIYLVRGWRSLWATTFVGGWAVIGSVVWQTFLVPRDQWAVQGAISVALLVFWGLPVLRAAMPGRWKRPALGLLDKLHPLPDLDRAPLHVHVSAGLTPFIALWLMHEMWQFTAGQHGLLYGLAGLVSAGVWLVVHRRALDPLLAHTHVILSALLTTAGLVVALDGDARLVGVAGQALLLLLLGKRLRYQSLTLGGHALWVCVGAVMLDVLTRMASGPALINGAALAHLAVIGLAIATSFGLRREAAWIYRVCAHVALLGWFGRELLVLPNGNGYVSLAWGMLGVAALVGGIWRVSRPLWIIGMSTLALVVAKLLLVDLSQVEAIWRILLFIGFGTLFLMLSYYLQMWQPKTALWQPKAAQRHQSE